MSVLLHALSSTALSAPLSARPTASDSDGVVVVVLAILLILGALLVVNQTSKR